MRTSSANARLALSALGVAGSVALTACGGDPPRTQGPAAPPDDRAEIPRVDARYVHRTFHRLRRSCGPGRSDRRRLDATTTRFVRLYRRYPAERFRMRIDDESGTMLSAILVLRYELAGCSPDHAARIDAVLPPRVRRALRPRLGEAADPGR